MTLHSQRFATETLIRLSEKIPNVSIILEYSIKPYRVDAYLPDHNISIEIDENDHHSYDPEKEFERSKFITNTLHCSWIRVNNSDTVENTVESLLKQLKYYGISSTTAIITKTAETAQNKSYTQQLKEYKANLAEEAARVELERLLHRGKGPSTAAFADVFEITHNPNDKLSYEDMEFVFARTAGRFTLENGTQIKWSFDKRAIRQYLMKEHHLERISCTVKCKHARRFIGVKFRKELDEILNGTSGL